MADLRALTKDYVAAFNAKDIAGVGALMAEGFTLTDPEVTGLTPKAAVLEYIKGLFEANPGAFSFVAEGILVEGNASVIEFVLTLGETVLKGADLITWEDGLMVSMRAHLTAQG